jgi:hypothetical protein
LALVTPLEEEEMVQIHPLKSQANARRRAGALLCSSAGQPLAWFTHNHVARGCLKQLIALKSRFWSARDAVFAL